jgi:phage-related minor tail protein
MTNFQEFDGEHLKPIDTTDVPVRRASDASLEIIAHKISRIATDFAEHKHESTKAIERLEQSMRYTHATLTESIQKASAAAEAAKESVKTNVEEAMHSAFPFGDSDAHRKVHENYIREAEERVKFWKKLRDELAKYGLLAFFGFAAVALWKHFLQGPHA